MLDAFGDPARIDIRLDSRSISFENPTGARGSGGIAHAGRKGAPQRIIAPGERIALADIAGPGRVRHVWLTASPMPPEEMRRLVLEVFYDGLPAPSVSVPLLDFFGCAHGRPVPLVTAYTAFVLLPDASLDSHRLLLAVWLLATVVGTAAGVAWVRRTARPAN